MNTEQNDTTLADDNDAYRRTLTIAQVREAYSNLLKGAECSTQEIRNCLIPFCKLQEHAKIGDDDRAERLFGSDFDNILSSHLIALSNARYSNRTIRDRASKSRQARRFYQEIVKDRTLPNCFAECLRHSIDLRKKTVIEVARTCGCGRRTVFAWLSGVEKPRLDSMIAIGKIEQFLSLEPGTLTERAGLNYLAFQKAARAKERPELSDDERHRRKVAREALRYRLLDSEVSELLRAEWLDFVRFKSSPILAEGEKRNSVWRLKTKDRITCDISWASANGKKFAVSAEKSWFAISSFFGFLIRPQLAGTLSVRIEELTLSYLSDSRRIIAYLQYLEERHGAYTMAADDMVKNASAMLRPETGYLWQKTEFCSRMKGDVSARV